MLRFLPIAWFAAAAALPAQEQEGEQQAVRSLAGFESLTIGGQLRARAEVADPSAPITTAPGDHEGRIRARATIDARWDEFLGAYFQFQRNIAGTGSPSASLVHQAFVRLDRVLGSYQVTGGRFEMALGSGRMIDPDDWQLNPVAFDGGAITGRYDPVAFTLWVTQPVQNQGGLSQTTDFYGAYTTWDGLEDFVLDLYGFRLNDRATRIDERTIGLRAYGEAMPNLYWSFEGALQSGDRGNLDVSADALVLQGAYSFADGHNLGAEWSVASGDENPADNKSETFRAPFPNTHAFQGIADVLAWRNLDDIAVKYWLQWNPQWTIHIDVHDFVRRTTNDAIYGGPGGAGLVGTRIARIGNEVDLYFEGELNENVGISFGGAWFHAASGIRNANDQLWLYGQLELFF